MADSTTARTDRRHWLLATLAGMASYLDSGVIITVGLSLATWRSELGLSALTLGVISATLTLSIAVGALVGGRLADLLGRRRMFTADLAVYVVGVAMVAAADGPVMIIGGVAVAGLAAGADLPTSIAVVSELAPEGARARLVAFTQVMWSVGISVVTVLGFAVSALGLTGVRLLFVHLALLGAITWVLRAFSPPLRRLEAEALGENRMQPQSAMPLRALVSSRSLLGTIALTGLFYVAWNLMANTIGQFKVFYLVTVSGADQTLATGLSFVISIISLGTGIAFVRIADTRLRRPLFYVGALLQVVAMAIGALSGGTVLGAMVALLVIYNLAYPIAGEALYKVWTQEGFPANARASVQGFTYSVSRLLCAGFALVTPLIAEANPAALLWILAGCAAASGLVGSALIQRLAHHPAADPAAHRHIVTAPHSIGE